MKKHELFFSSIKIPLDFWSVLLAFFVAREIRLFWDLIPWITLPIQTIENTDLQFFALIWALLYVLLFASHGLYALNISGSKIAEILGIIRYSIYWFLFYCVGVYFWNEILYSEVDIPRLIILFTTIISICFSIFIRIILNAIQSYFLHKGLLEKRNLILISSKWPRSIWHILQDIHNSSVYNIWWYMNKERIESFGKKIPYIENISILETLAQKREVDEILYIESDFSRWEIYQIWEIAHIYGIRYKYITNSVDITKTNTQLSLIHKTPVIEILATPLQNWWRIAKRTFDICFSLLHILILFPLFVIIACVIKFDDPRAPIIYKNIRKWQNWQLFFCYKFRYLRWKDCIKDAYGIDHKNDPAFQKEQDLIHHHSKRKGPLYKIENDPRKTKVWFFLEKYSLDELPQLFNVLLWDMSIVWPRPHQIREVQKYSPYQKRVLTIKPGITWMAQVNGREKNNFEKEAKLDIFYIENWSFLLDLKILCKTYPAVFFRK